MSFPNAHFYSPVPDFDDLRRRRDRIWRPVDEVPGVELNIDGQIDLLGRLATHLTAFAAYEEPGEPADPRCRFEEANPFFSGLDSRLLFCLLNELRPRRFVEVGSGYSSLLAADVNTIHLDGEMELTCIDPNPQSFLLDGVPGMTRLLTRRVEDVELALFLELGEGDVLFIDSSHVIKTGNDVHFLYLEVIPRLAKGVLIHVHDVFLPREYPSRWVLDENRAWNEQYLLQALLVHSSALEVLIGSACAYYLFPRELEAAFGARYGGGSMWMKSVK